MRIRLDREWRALALVLAVVVAAAVLLYAAGFPGDGRGSASPATSSSTGPAEIAASTASAGGEASPAGASPAVPPSVSAQPSALGTRASYEPAGFRVDSNLAFTAPVSCGSTTCQIRLDVYVPGGVGPFPTVVLVRGGPSGLGGRSYLDPFAGALANLGFLVFNADYRDEASQGGGYPEAFQDVACAVRYARAQAGRYDGIASPLTLVGHSLGGWVGSVVALDPAEFDGGCLVGGSGRPEAFVGLAGNYDLSAPGEVSDLYTFFGGSAAQTAQARAASDPFNYATGNPIPVRLVAGTSDVTVDPAASASLDEFLIKRNWDASLDLVPGATHSSILSLDGDGSHSVQALYSALAAAQAVGSAPTFKAGG
jgi:acetyl esterase/lipase